MADDTPEKTPSSKTREVIQDIKDGKVRDVKVLRDLKTVTDRVLQDIAVGGIGR